MDVIVVENRQPIQRPSLTVVIDVHSRMVLGFAIYLEKPSAFTAGLAIAHAVLPKEQWLADCRRRGRRAGERTGIHGEREAEHVADGKNDEQTR
jgi:transposase InsO family protein